MEDGKSKRLPIAVTFAASFVVLVGMHLPLLRLPYFWDEAGYYVPAARDLLLTGSLIPHSTPSNAHPPLVMAYLALCWKMAGFTPVVTRVAMLLLAAFSLTGLFRLAEQVSNRAVAIATVCCAGLYPVFFAQSSLAQVDLPAAGLTFWALSAYAANRRPAAAAWFTLAALAKETAIIAPLALLVWETVTLVGPAHVRKLRDDPTGRIRTSLLLLLPVAVLGCWYVYHYRATGYLLGNPEYFRYNVRATLSPLRFFLALMLRLWQVIGYLHLWVLTAAMGLAMFVAPRKDGATLRPRIGLPVQFAFLAIAAAYVAFLSAVGGAVLARYVLPVVPLVILISVSTLWRRVRAWIAVVVLVMFGFVVALFVPPPYGFSFEDNLAYRDYIVMHENAARYLQEHFPAARVLTAWPASDEIRQPYLGYVTRPLRAVRIENFAQEEIFSAAEARSSYDVAFVFSTKYQPSHPLFARWRAWQSLKSRFFGYHQDLPPQAIAQLLGGQIEFMETRRGQWVAVISIERIVEAQVLERELHADIK